MGYTNYYQTNEVHHAKVWTPFLVKVEKIFKAAAAKGVLLTGGHNGPAPIANAKHVWLNGSPDDDSSHETFVIEWKSGEWRFCKTNRKPYDAVVKAILIVAYEAGIVTEWSSDGEEGDIEYLNALDLLK